MCSFAKKGVLSDRKNVHSLKTTTMHIDVDCHHGLVLVMFPFDIVNE